VLLFQERSARCSKTVCYWWKCKPTMPHAKTIAYNISTMHKTEAAPARVQPKIPDKKLLFFQWGDESFESRGMKKQEKRETVPRKRGFHLSDAQHGSCKVGVSVSCQKKGGHLRRQRKENLSLSRQINRLGGGCRGQVTHSRPKIVAVGLGKKGCPSDKQQTRRDGSRRLTSKKEKPSCHGTRAVFGDSF